MFLYIKYTTEKLELEETKSRLQECLVRFDDSGATLNEQTADGTQETKQVNFLQKFETYKNVETHPWYLYMAISEINIKFSGLAKTDFISKI